MDPLFILYALIGLLALTGAIFAPDWFMTTRQASFMAKILGGRGRARVFYGLLGVSLLAPALAAAMDMIWGG